VALENDICLGYLTMMGIDWSKRRPEYILTLYPFSVEREFPAEQFPAAANEVELDYNLTSSDEGLISEFTCTTSARLSRAGIPEHFVIGAVIYPTFAFTPVEQA
jgi:hypothetical protein